MVKMAWNVISKGGASNVAQMSWRSIDEMLRMWKYSHFQNMIIYGAGKDEFIIFQSETP